MTDKKSPPKDERKGSGKAKTPLEKIIAGSTKPKDFVTDTDPTPPPLPKGDGKDKKK